MKHAETLTPSGDIVGLAVASIPMTGDLPAKDSVSRLHDEMDGAFKAC
jgi:hypothetical protein